jgi:hypothetical protein
MMGFYLQITGGVRLGAFFSYLAALVYTIGEVLGVGR